MDQSLDEYMKKKSNRRPISQRVGIKRSPAVKRTTFKVTGIGNVKGFDARQRLATKREDARNLIDKKKFVPQKITAPTDARTNTFNKTKFVDARVRIENKQAKPQDLRVKVENAQARKTDARTKITLNRQKQASTQGPQIRVTGLGNPSLKRGSVSKTINAKTKNKQTDGQRRGGVRVSGNNLVITRNAQPESTDISSLPGNGHAPIIKIKNEHYRPPASAKQIPVRTTPRMDQSVFSRAVAESVMHSQALPQPMYEHPSQPQTVVQYVPVVEAAQFMAPVQAAQPPATAPHPAHLPHAPAQQPAHLPHTPALQPAHLPHAYINPEFSASSAQRLGAQPPATSRTSGSTQQYRVLITNLHHIVSQDDIVELFGAVGALKRARILRAGTAEVVYLNKDDAHAACRKYHNRELDGQPMQVHVASEGSRRNPMPKVRSPPRQPTRVSASPSPPRQLSPPRRAASPDPPAKQQEHMPLTLGKHAPPTKLKDLDIGLVNKALFKMKGPGPSRPVTFTVKI